MTIGEATRLRILELCREHHHTINSLSIQCGLTQSTLNNIVNGRNKGTNISTIKKICDGLDITVNEFFDNPLFFGLEQEIK